MAQDKAISVHKRATPRSDPRARIKPLQQDTSGYPMRWPVTPVWEMWRSVKTQQRVQSATNPKTMGPRKAVGMQCSLPIRKGMFSEATDRVQGYPCAHLTPPCPGCQWCGFTVCCFSYCMPWLFMKMAFLTIPLMPCFTLRLSTLQFGFVGLTVKWSYLRRHWNLSVAQTDCKNMDTWSWMLSW